VRAEGEKLQAIMKRMKQDEILKQIAGAGSWLPITVVAQAMAQHKALAPIFLEAVRRRAAIGSQVDVPQSRLATFGLFYLAQHRDPRLLKPLIRLFETIDPYAHDEWHFANRLFCYGHRLLAGVCPLDCDRPMSVAMDGSVSTMTRAIAISAVGLSAVYGDTRREEAVIRLRTLFESVKARPDEWLDSNWVRAATKIQCREFERELQWFMASGRLNRLCREEVESAMHHHPDEVFFSSMQFEAPVNLLENIFSRDFRRGEAGLLPNNKNRWQDKFWSRDSDARGD
jgi:hypothetical protein